MGETWCREPTWQQTRRLQHFSAYGSGGIPARVFVIPLLLEFSGTLGVARLEPALSALARRHEALRYVFHEHGAGRWAVTSRDDGGARLTVVDPNSDTGKAMWEADIGTRALEVLVDFRPGRVEHLVACLSHRGGRSRLLLLVDHMVADGRSCEILLRDLARYYRDQVSAATVEPDIAGRDGIRQLTSVCEKATIPDRLVPLAEHMKAHSAFAWVEMPVLQSWDVPQGDAAVTDVPLLIDLQQFDAACASSRSTRFVALMTAVHVALREYSNRPGYAYLYPSLRELFGVADSVGWFSGMAVVELEPADLDLVTLLRRYTGAIADAVTDGWAISEHLHMYAHTHKRLPTRPSVSVDAVVESAGRTWDFGACEAFDIPIERPRVPVRGRICFGLATTATGIAVRLLSEPGRYAQTVIDNLGRRAARCLTEIVDRAT